MLRALCAEAADRNLAWESSHWNLSFAPADKSLASRSVVLVCFDAMSAEPAGPVPDTTVAALADLPKKVIIGTKNAYKFGYEYEYTLAQVGVGPDFVYTLNKKEGQEEDLCIKKEGGYWVVYEYTLEQDGSGGLVAGKLRFRTGENMAVAGDHTWEMYDEKKEDWFGSLLCRTEIE